MKNKFLILILLLLSPLLTYGALDLKKAYEGALNNMETIHRASAVISQSEEQKRQARALVLPTLSGIGSYTKIDPPSNGGPSPFLLTRQHVAALRLTQPLLRGGSLAAYQLAKENVLLARFQKDATELNLYQLVINAYYSLSESQSDVRNVKELLNLSLERVQEIRKRVSIGRSRRGELLEVEAQQHIARAQYQEALMRLQEREKSFEFLTSISPEVISLENKIPEVRGNLEDYLNKIRTRPDILALYQEEKVAQKQIEIARGGHFPQVDFISNYYIDRTGILSTSEWDLGVQVSLPLFQGGVVQSSVREALQGKRIVELRSLETERSAQRDIQIHHQNLLQLQEQLKSVKEALIKSQEAYKLSLKDYQFGLVTNLDVLRSMNVYIDTKRSYDGLISVGHLNYKNLEALTGSIPGDVK
jgi:outer membrane protein